MSKFNLNRENTILLVIDIQDRLVPVMEYKDQVIQNTKVLLEGARQMNIPVIVTEQYPKGLGNTVEDINKDLGDAQVFSKNSFTAYIDEVKSALKDIGRKKIIIVGMETHICVYQTTRDLISDGYDVHIVRDAMASRTKENFLSGLDLMENMGAVISNTETIVFDLLKKAGTPEFKIMSKLIK